MHDLSEITFDLWTALLIFGFLQGLFLGMILMLGKTRKKSRYFLIGLILIVSLNLLNYVVIHSNLYTKIPHLVNLSLPLLFLLGPLFYFYLKSVLSSHLVLKLSDILHLVPLLLAIVFLIPFFALPGSAKIDLLHEQIRVQGQPMDISTLVFLLAQIIQSLIYVVIGVRMLSRHTIAGSHNGHEIKKMELLRKFSIGFLLFWLVDFVAVLWYLQKGFIDIRAYYLTMLCCALAINVLVALAIRSNRTFMEVFLDMTRVKYKSSNLLKSELKQHLQEITSYMQVQKPYLDHELSLSKLSSDLGKPKYLISQVLNVELGKSFYEFLSEYRYKEVRSRLSNPKYHHLTILAIAYDSGFSNKNTFNKVFKRLAGVTPSQFLKSVPDTQI